MIPTNYLIAFNAMTNNVDFDDAPLSRVTIDATQSVLNICPSVYNGSNSKITHVLKMNSTSPVNPTTPVLLAQGTGGGKSSVCQTIGVIKSTVCCAIENVLFSCLIKNQKR